MPPLQGHSVPLRLAGVLVLLLLPLGGLLGVYLRLRWKTRAAAAFFGKLEDELRSRGFLPQGQGRFEKNGRGAQLEVSTNPLLGRGFTVRLAAFSKTVHEFELKRGAPLSGELRGFGPLLERWESAGKMYLECYAAGVTRDPSAAGDLDALLVLAELPLARTYRGGTFTLREGFEKDVPQWHWRHDLRPLLPPGVQRFCVSYWTGSPLLSPVLVRLFADLASGTPFHYLTHQVDLGRLRLAFHEPGLALRGAVVQLPDPAMPVAADLHSDGEFFGGLLAAREAPPAFQVPGLPRTRFHELAVRALGTSRLYVRRLFDDECSWYSGEYEILSVSPLPVRDAVQHLAREMGAGILEIDRRFHRRLVEPRES